MLVTRGNLESRAFLLQSNGLESLQIEDEEEGKVEKEEEVRGDDKQLRLPMAMI